MSNKEYMSINDEEISFIINQNKIQCNFNKDNNIIREAWDKPSTRNIECLMGYACGYKLIHSKQDGIDLKYNENDNIYGEVKSININSKKFEFDVRATKNVIEKYINKRLWFIASLWDATKCYSCAMLIGKYDDMKYDMVRQYKKHINNLTKEKYCTFTLPHLINDLNFKVISMYESRKSVFSLLKNAHRNLNLKCEDIIPYETFVDNVNTYFDY